MSKRKPKKQAPIILEGIEPFDMSDIQEFDGDEAHTIDPNELHDGFELLKEAVVIPNP